MKDQRDTKPEKRFDFGNAIKAAYTRYPEINGRVFFLDGPSREVMHPDEDIGKIAVDFCNKDAGFARLLNRAFEFGRHTRLRMPGGIISFIVFYPEDKAGYQTDDIKDDFLNFVFNHELGHALFDSSRENIADGFALLRHMQDKPADDRLVHRVAFGRAAHAVDRGALKHYTLPLITRLLKLRETMDFTRLNKEQTKSMVKELDNSFPFRHSADTARDFDKAFAPYRKAENSQDKCRALQKIIARTYDKDIFEAASTVLTAMSDPRIDTGGDMQVIKSLSSFERDNIRKNIDKKARRLSISEYYPQFMPRAAAP